MSYGWKKNGRRIPFDNIQSGDRLRVRYSEGGGAKFSNSTSIQGLTGVRNKGCVGVTRTAVSTAHFKALDLVWLDESGRTVAHRDWDEMEILLLEREGEEYEPSSDKPKMGRWEEDEIKFLTDNWDRTDHWIGWSLNRPKMSVYQKRRNIQKKEACA